MLVTDLLIIDVILLMNFCWGCQSVIIWSISISIETLIMKNQPLSFWSNHGNWWSSTVYHGFGSLFAWLFLFSQITLGFYLEFAPDLISPFSEPDFQCTDILKQIRKRKERFREQSLRSTQQKNLTFFRENFFWRFSSNISHMIGWCSLLHLITNKDKAENLVFWPSENRRGNHNPFIFGGIFSKSMCKTFYLKKNEFLI